jgi:hypothetical protein
MTEFKIFSPEVGFKAPSNPTSPTKINLMPPHARRSSTIPSPVQPAARSPRHFLQFQPPTASGAQAQKIRGR